VALAADDYREGATDRAGLAARLRRDSASPRPGLRVRAWQIRVDREGAEVGEDYEETGAEAGAGREGAEAGEAGAGRDVRPLRARYRLEWNGERWVFAAGL
jgi:hypothetical protein